MKRLMAVATSILFIAIILPLAGAANSCVGSLQSFVCGNTVTQSCTMNGNLATNGLQDCFDIVGNNIALDCAGYSITGTSNSLYYGIASSGNSNVMVTNCITSKFNTSYYFYNSNGITVSNDISFNTTYGFNFTMSSNILATNNIAHNNKRFFSTFNALYGVSFMVYNDIYYSFINNYARNATYGFYAYNNLIGTNGIWKNNIAINHTEGFYVYNTNNNIFVNNTSSNGTDNGFLVWLVNNNTFTHNFASNNHWHGFRIHASSHNLWTNNSATGSTAGFVQDYTSFDTYNGNHAYKNSVDGFEIYAYDNNLTFMNNLADNNTGIGGFYFGNYNNNNLIANNLVSNNINSYGFEIETNGNGNIFANNIVVNHTRASFFVEAVNTVFRNNRITGYTIGNVPSGQEVAFYMVSGSNNIVSNNICNFDTYGLYTISASNNIIINNTFTNSLTGIYIQGGQNNFFINNSNNFGYNGPNIQFYSQGVLKENPASSGNIGWWPLLTYNMSTSNSAIFLYNDTAWYGGSKQSGKNSDGTTNTMLHYWYDNLLSGPLTTPLIYVSVSPLIMPRQKEVFTAYAFGGNIPYTYNIVVYNSVTNSPIAWQNSAQNTFSWTVPNSIGETVYANVIVTDNSLAIANSVKTGILTIVPIRTATISPASIPSIHINQYTTLYENFTANIVNGTSPYTYNFIISNALTGNIVTSALYSGVNANTYTARIQIPASVSAVPGSFWANVVVTDANSITANSVSSSFTILPPSLMQISEPSVMNIYPGQNETFTATVYNALAPYNYTFTMFDASTGNIIARKTYTGISSNTYTASMQILPWQGPIELQANVVVIDSDSAIANSIVTPYPIAASIPVGVNPRSIAINPSGTLAYVTNEGSNNVSVINLAQNRVVNSIAVSSYPTSIAINPSGTLAYVGADSGNISVINLAQNRTIKTIFTNYTYTSPEVSFSPSGAIAYVINYNTYADSVYIINVSQNLTIGKITVSSYMESIVFSPSGSFAYISGPFAVTYNRLPHYPIFIGWNVSVIDVSNATVVNTIGSSIPSGFSYMAINPKGTLAYVTHEYTNNISVIDLTKNIVTKSIPVGIYPVAIAFNPSGTLAYVVNSGSDNLSIIDVMGGRTIGSIPVGYEPRFIAFSPSSTFAYIIAGTNKVDVIQTKNTISVLKYPSGSGGPSKSIVTLSDNIPSGGASSKPVFTVYAANVTTSVYQNQLPYTLSLPDANKIINFACNVTVSGKTYAFQNDVYGLGYGIRCGRNYTTYVLGNITAIYALSVGTGASGSSGRPSTTSSTTTTVPISVARQNTTSSTMQTTILVTVPTTALTVVQNQSSSTAPPPLSWWEYIISLIKAFLRGL